MRGGQSRLLSCAYHDETGIRRPCNAGKGCTVKETRRGENGGQRSKEEKRSWYEKQKEQRRRNVRCANCNKEFSTTDSRKICCCDECARQWHVKKMRAYYARKRAEADGKA